MHYIHHLGSPYNTVNPDTKWRHTILNIVFIFMNGGVLKSPLKWTSKRIYEMIKWMIIDERTPGGAADELISDEG